MRRGITHSGGTNQLGRSARHAGRAGLVPTSAEVQAGRTRPQGRLNSFLDCRATLAISCSVLRLLL